MYAEHQEQNVGVLPSKVNFIPLGLCLLLCGDSVLLHHEHTTGTFLENTLAAGIWVRVTEIRWPWWSLAGA